MKPSSYSWLGQWSTAKGRTWLYWLLAEKWTRALPYPNWRCFFLRLGGAVIGRSSFVHETVFHNPQVNGFKNLVLGDRATVQTQVLIDLADRVTLEDDVTVSAGVSIFTHEDCGAKMGKPLGEYFPPRKAPVTLKRGCWIGARATILCGVTVGECAVVGAGSLVNQDVPAWTVVGGVPARMIRTIEKKTAMEVPR